jgi:hypothetical protein
MTAIWASGQSAYHALRFDRRTFDGRAANLADMDGD